MTKREKHAALARRMRANAERLRKRGRKDWADGEEMLRVVESDYEDHILIAKLLRVGKCELAAVHMHNLDTSSYEDIPQTVYDYLDRYY